MMEQPEKTIHTIGVTKSSESKSHKTQPVKITDFDVPFGYIIMKSFSQY